ncbi:MAG: hypothetical protein UT37_C0002G0035 [Parcubacteria group bacterium GW2011_GWA2_39_18]|nr:MAG: hypothetical protein UT37_C0002G0035 [Parcubacteria group bacterium GW2011_GWA2_39_18]
MQKNGFILHFLILVLVVLIILSFLGLFNFKDLWNKFKNTAIGKLIAPLLESLYNSMVKPVWNSLKGLFVSIWEVIKGWFWSNTKNIKVEVNLSPSVGLK